MSWSEVKYALNSSLGTDEFAPLDKLIKYYIYLFSDTAKFVEYSAAGTYNVSLPEWATRVKVTACGGGGGGAVALSSGEYQTKTYGGGGGGAAAILDEVHDIPKSVQGTIISVMIGAGGAGAMREGNGADGNATTITALGITLLGGKKGTSDNSSTAEVGGAAGGPGGGKGGNAGENGAPGITGAGGAKLPRAGGGGGSLGAGGNASYDQSTATTSTNSGTRGGGGGAAPQPSDTYSVKAGSGGDGYVKLEFLP